MIKCRRDAHTLKDFQHKLSRKIVDSYDLIAVEKLNIRGMVCNHHLSKSISDAAWGQFLSFIIYKAAEAGKWCIEVEPKGTSQECCKCEGIVAKKLSDRIHKCHHCGLVLNRDHNAEFGFSHSFKSHKKVSSFNVYNYRYRRNYGK